MTKRLISSGSTFEEQIGYSRAVVVGDWVFVSGTTGYDYQTMCISDDLPDRASRTSFASPMSCPTKPISRRAGRCCANTSGTCARRR